ncbi:MAG: type IV-A pilus assembly ATPase PilB [Gammaproteobacteria bacterium]|nr:type IV-A pilus assembly ATPase PilB [Gammaproteobacteria bacterium]MCW8839811.1 type IV-A pilus assembly ATPase PilB [Gammaproteobacteria bacterium]MCW8927449.1 type IV-A pilus assembly ATPase PilB [Gammaproteobacteria bacterium]MCW8958151.1 type IV-A pilus assembly ATPase PilB [Gammaproteobacteria bacterium]MCW8973878.1 type IV-A pilus assembly ATPase PilB [Gammaproteobacteria bacterium]
MATTNLKATLSGLARKLINDGLLSEEDALKITEAARTEKMSFVSYAVSKNKVSAKALAMAAAQEFGVPVFDLDAMELDPDTTRLVEEKLIRHHHALPLFKRGNRLYVAVSDPTNLVALDEIRFHVSAHTEAVLVEEDKLARTIDKAMEASDTSMQDLGDASLDDLDISSEDEKKESDVHDTEIDDAPVVRFVNKILLDAINKDASDIHFEPYEKRYRVRLRQDGMLSEFASPPIQLAGKISARIKVMSRLDISEKRVPQDGRIKLTLSKNKAIDFRVSTCPTLFGEKIVLRILDPSSAKLGIDALGYEPEQKQLYLDNLAKPYGMILVTGPTGSGKTVSLYTGLNILNTPDVNISTAEDPAEINLEGINQVNVNPKVGLTFAAALKAFLRQDPDIIMVGEIRDLETAEIAIKAAQTGHMVMSTLHTNDAPQTIARLMNIGVPPYNIASALNLIIAQRLGRRLCNHCKTLEDIPRETLIDEGFTEEEIPNLKIYKAVGCDQCTDGYKGRVGIYQVLPISEEMGKLIMKAASAYEMADQAAKEGVPDLRQSALKKVRNGVTSLEEINRVTKD